MARYVSDAVVELLAELGCRYLPLNPGSSFRGLHDSLVNRCGAQGPQPILCTGEGVAVAAAHAYAKATRRVAFAAVHDLVGLMQATMGLYNAWCDRTPMVVLGGGGPIDPAKRRPVDWLHSASVQANLVRDYVKWDDEPTTAAGTLDGIARAHRLAASAPTGPTYVTIDAEVQEQLADGLTVPTRQSAEPDPPSAARDREVEAAADALLHAEQPVVVAGRVGIEPGCTPLLVDLGELLGAALYDERNLTALPTVHPLNLSGDSSILCEADVVLGVDLHDLNRLADRAAREHGRPYIIDLSQNTMALSSWSNAGHGHVADLTLPAAARTGLEQLLEVLRERARDRNDQQARRDRTARLARRHQAVRDAAREELEQAPPDGVSPVRLVHEVWMAVRNHPWLLTLRNTRSWPEGIWEFDVGGRFLGHSGGGGIGYGPGALLGGALAARDRGELPVGIIGDGDLQYGPGVLWTACHYGVPMLVVVNNNRSYYNDEEHQIQVAQLRGRPVGNAHVAIRMDEPAIGFAQLARAHGAAGIGPVKSADDLPAALQTAVDTVLSGGVALVDVHTT